MTWRLAVGWHQSGCLFAFPHTLLLTQQYKTYPVFKIYWTFCFVFCAAAVLRKVMWVKG